MGILSSAYSWLHDKLNINSIAGSTPPANMSLNSSGNHISRPVKIEPDSGLVNVYDPVSNSFSSSVKNIKDAISKGVSVNRDDLTKPRFTTGTGDHSASEVYFSPVSPAQIDYLNAELASHYGMSKETAYQEALSNTAYQRSVKDMQSAGLNPAVIYGAGKGSPADGVYSVRSASPIGASGGSSGYSGRSSGSSKNNGKLFTTGEFYGISAAAGLVSAVVSGNPNSYWIGQTVAQGFMTAANSLLRK